jgi:hypothetical protein
VTHRRHHRKRSSVELCVPAYTYFFECVCFWHDHASRTFARAWYRIEQRLFRSRRFALFPAFTSTV